MAKRILLVDDEPLILKGLKFSLEQDGYETESERMARSHWKNSARAGSTWCCWT